jgi:hypothetical protein
MRPSPEGAGLQAVDVRAGAEGVLDGVDHLGFGPIIDSEIEAPIIFVNLVQNG